MPTTSENAIELKGVGKSFRIIGDKGGRILDALGLRPPNRGGQDFWALRDVDLTIPEGQRVGFVGRNGAGKTTLLKLISGLLRPTTGTVAVKGRVHALLELGTGFHPEFSGRENVLSALSYLGVTGRDAHRLSEEIVDFAELDKFIERPFRTYSAGMQARLTFAVATSIKPEIMIVDEILGAGDAYFSGKAVARMKELTGGGCTLLYVSHDMASVQMMCERAIWIDRGGIRHDGDTLTVGKMYAASIRRQEELRLRSQALALHNDNLAPSPDDDQPGEPSVVARLVLANDVQPTKSHPVFEIALRYRENDIERLTVGGARDNDASERVHIIQQDGYTDWSAARVHDGRRMRAFENRRGRYKHAPFVFRAPIGLKEWGQFSLEVTHASDTREAVEVQVFAKQAYRKVGRLSEGAGVRTDSFAMPFELLEEWLRRLEADPAVAEAEAETEARYLPESREMASTEVAADASRHIADGDVYGSGEATITAVRVTGSSGFIGDDDQHVFSIGESLLVSIAWVAREPIDDIVFVVAVYSEDGRCVTQTLSAAHRIAKGAGTIKADFGSLRLGEGKYVISVGMFRGLRETDTHGQHPVSVLDRRYLIKVIKPNSVRLDLGQFVHPVTWSVARAVAGS